MGFGIYKVAPDGSVRYPSRMQEANNVPIQSATICNNPEYHISNFDKETDLCVGSIFGQRVNASLGDSGSPAVQVVNGEYVDVGITSHGAPYEYGWETPLPSVYTFTGAFYNWIEKQITSNQ